MVNDILKDAALFYKTIEKKKYLAHARFLTGMNKESIPKTEPVGKSQNSVK